MPKPNKEMEATVGEIKSVEKLLELPEIKSIGLVKLPNSNNWVSYLITTKGKKVISIEAGEPDLYEVAEEAAKVSFVHNFMDNKI